MRILLLRISLGAALFFSACAHERPMDTPVPPTAVAAYRSVRAGELPTNRTNGVEFCAADGAVEVVRTVARSTDDWADKFRDSDLRQEIRDLVGRDPTLSGQPITVDVAEGEAIVSGTVQRDADALAAARDALAVPGVVAVQLRTASAESPAHPTLVAVECQ
jgi:BON domain